jgi:hypothetical protein
MPHVLDYRMLTKIFHHDKVDAYVNSWLMDHADKAKLADSRVTRVKDHFSDVQRELRRRF